MSKLPVGYQRVEGSNRFPVPGAVRIGPADPDERASVSIRLRRRADAPPIGNLAQSPSRSARLTHEEFAATYGADPDDIVRVEAFANDHGLTVHETSIPRRTVVLTGTVAQLGEAFKVDLGRYQVGETSYRGREGHVHLPADLAPLVEGVFGLDNRQQARPLFRSGSPAQAASPAQTTQPLTPPEVATLYNFPTWINAAGQCIGLLEFGGGYNPADITAWFTNLGLTPPVLADVGVDGAGNSPGSNADTEVILDIDVAGAVGQGARIAVYFAPWTEQGWVDVVTTAVHDATNDPSVLSISWGWPELESIDGLTWTQAAMDAVSTTFQEAAALGVTVLAASGDQGSDCQIGDNHAHVIYPGCDPFVTSCGGTEIENMSGANFTEVLWNHNGASGGGVSVNFPVPAWQGSVAVPTSVNDGHHGRSIPDIAGNASPNSGYMLTQNGGQNGPIGGTSAVGPLYAGLVAILNARLTDRVGYLNPVLYQAAAGLFRDVTCCGNNGFNGAPGYSVGAGWDATTGFGSVIGTSLLAELQERAVSVKGRDIALVRQTPGWASIPIALSNGDGTWKITNGPATPFIGNGDWASGPGVRVVTGDFNGNGLTDIALVRQTPGWASIPIAFSNGDGTWTITNGPATPFIGNGDWASGPGVRVVTGDFNGNGLTDIALVRQTPGWASIPIAFSNGDGTWTITNGPATPFIGNGDWASGPGVHVVTGDFNGNGLTDIALVRQTPGWASIPIAFSNGDGTWTITNGPATPFIGNGDWASGPGVHVVTGDFNGNGLTDIALVRQTPGWASIPIAFSNGDGTWTITNGPATPFIGNGDWASGPGVRVVTGDFNGNGLTDIALVRQTPGWASIPIAFSNGDGTWTITNGPATPFIGNGDWASGPGVRVVTGDFNDNGLTDIALVRQTPGWASIPIAFSNGDGTWKITNGPATPFIGNGDWASGPGVDLVIGNFH